ncbi:MAG: catalase [Leptospiraceae bacterium]|nr:catalase [Leptospiraceae bacterium]
MSSFFELSKNFHKIASLNSRNIPERLTHTKGYGAFGKFFLTHNVNEFTKAELFTNIDVTRVFVRFSNYKGERGFPDTIRDPRGIAIKFYTRQGNFDLTANSIPVFFIREPAVFPEFLASQKRDAQTNLFNPDKFWSFFSKYPQSLHALLFYFSERSLPKSFRHAHYYSCNALKFYNSKGEYFVKFHIKTLQGIQNFDPYEAEELAGRNPDFYGEDLMCSIEEGNFPKWKIYFQVIRKEEISEFSFNPFDATKVWSQKKFPLQELGILELNENPKDYFQEVEKVAFSPLNLVDGITLSPDPILQMRALVYPDAQRYRLGLEYENLKINQASKLDKFHSNGYAYDIQNENTVFDFQQDDFSQPRKFLEILNESQKNNLRLEIIKNLSKASKDVRQRVFQVLENLDKSFFQNAVC